MNPLLIVAGVLLLTWPLQYRRSMSRIRVRVVERGGDLERLDRAMDRWWIRAALWLAPGAGIAAIVLGVTGG